MISIHKIETDDILLIRPDDFHLMKADATDKREEGANLIQ